MGTGRKPSEFAAEAALVLIGIAGGFSLIDKLAGFTASWMRYMLTATRINQALIAFHFDWNELERKRSLLRSRVDPSAGNPPGDDPPRAPGTPPNFDDPVTEGIDLIKRFCMKILDIMDEETSGWADELKKNASQLASAPLVHGGRG